MHIVWTDREAAEATQGESVDRWEASGIHIDSREINKGDLFIALKGEQNDGHNYVAAAFKNGAVAAVVERRPSGLDDSLPLLVVKDTSQALLDLAKYNRKRSDAKIIGVTGSVGKTSTKEALRVAFQGIGNTYASYSNFNNHLGVPISLARMPISTEYGIFEMGMSSAGEIIPLTKQVKPHLAIITTIAPVHLEYFESIQGIADAKAEIFFGVQENGYAILNKDNEFFDYLAKKAKAFGLKVMSFGEDKSADSRLIEYQETKSGSEVVASIFGKIISYKLGSFGKHLAKNTLAVLASVELLGGNLMQAAESLQDFRGQKGRGERHNINFNGKEILLIDDSYNAGPASVKASLKTFGAIEGNGRKIAILGDMRELGPESIQYHKALAQDIEQNKIDKVITMGELMQNLFEELSSEKRLASYQNVEELIENIDKHLVDNDKILVKGSLGTKIYKLVDYLMK
jgi:UDP-N-acetylmuramoyl-tripeptide--D-alanyl-D-alanine ligase